MQYNWGEAFISIFLASCFVHDVNCIRYRRQAQGCHTSVGNVRDFLATKTPYSSMEDPANAYKVPAGCNARQLWILNRHGTRNAGDVEALKSRLPKLRDKIGKATSGELCKSALDRLRSWNDFHIRVQEANQLVAKGKEELMGISRRYQIRFPQLMPRIYDKENYHFRHTVEDRTRDSAKAFIEAIFGSAGAKAVDLPAPPKPDNLLHFYKTCPKWTAEVDKNPRSYCEPYRFKKSELFLNVWRKVNNRLGTEGKPVSIRDILLAHKMCALETAWSSNPLESSPWCALFDTADLEALEYLEDLEDYWVDGYGYAINYEQACELLGDLLTRFSTKISSATKLLTTAYFGHSGTILKFYARLGLFKDKEQLTSAAFERLRGNRKWRNSLMGKFASNIAFVLLECSSGDKFRVQALVQERLVELPGCAGLKESGCPFEKFQAHFKAVQDSCMLKEICATTG